MLLPQEVVLRLLESLVARPGTAVTFKGGVEVKDASETVSTGSTTAFTSSLVTLECDCNNGTVFTHDIANGAVGIVSITNFPAVKNSFHTVSVIFTQASTNAGLGNTTGPTGIGTNITLKPQGVSGISTVARVGSGTTVTLSITTSDIDMSHLVYIIMGQQIQKQITIKPSPLRMVDSASVDRR